MISIDSTVSSSTGLLRRATQRHPERLFVDFDGVAHSYGDVWAQATQLAQALRNLGVGPGDVVATMLDNNCDNLALWYGTNLVGAIWVGNNTALRGEFLRHVVADSTAKVLVAEAEFLPRLIAIADDLPALPLVVSRGDAPADHIDRVHAIALAELEGAGPDAGWHEAGPDDVSLLVYTGGTTGPSKGCVNSHGYLLNLARRYLESIERRPDELNWSPLPMFHFNVLALTVTSSALLGGSAAIAPRFSVSQFWPEIERTGARVVNLLGAMGSLIAQMPDTPEMERCLGQLRVVHGAPFSPELVEIWRHRFGVPVVGGGMYGLTEAVPLTILGVNVDAPAGTSGHRNSLDFEVRVVDDHDVELPAGVAGEIVARPRRANVMFNGYWRRPDATLEATRNLWFHTGDIGRFDEDGFFTFVDRKKDYIRRRGENISSVELEAAFAAHPDIDTVAVHSVLSELSEDDVKITAVLVPGSRLTPRALFEWAVERVPYFALPRYIEFRSDLPTSAVGRVHKFALREQGCTPQTWDRERDDVTWERR